MARCHKFVPSPSTVHWGYFDGSLTSIGEIDSGDTLIIETVSGGPSDLPDDNNLEVSPVHHDIHSKCQRDGGGHILTGPISIKNAKPSDVLEVKIKDIELNFNWGYNRIRPLSGTLPEDFPHYQLTTIPIDTEKMTATLPWGTELQLDPFFGVMGTAPPREWGRQPSTVPRAFGGNLDIKLLTKGATIFLPVFVEGGLFSVGDGHGCQGDGEANGTAIETGLRGTFEIFIHRDMNLSMPRVETATHFISIGIDPSLDNAAKQALREMIRFICDNSNLSKEEAYTLCSLAADMRVSQTVNIHKGIHLMIPKSVIRG